MILKIKIKTNIMFFKTYINEIDEEICRNLFNNIKMNYFKKSNFNIINTFFYHEKKRDSSQ